MYVCTPYRGCTYIVCTCMLTYMYMYVHNVTMYMYLYLHLYMYTYLHVHVHSYTCTCTCAYMYTLCTCTYYNVQCTCTYNYNVPMCTYMYMYYLRVLTCSCTYVKVTRFPKKREKRKDTYILAEKAKGQMPKDLRNIMPIATTFDIGPRDRKTRNTANSPVQNGHFWAEEKDETEKKGRSEEIKGQTRKTKGQTRKHGEKKDAIERGASCSFSSLLSLKKGACTCGQLAHTCTCTYMYMYMYLRVPTRTKCARIYQPPLYPHVHVCKNVHACTHA